MIRSLLVPSLSANQDNNKKLHSKLECIGWKQSKVSQSPPEVWEFGHDVVLLMIRDGY